MKRRHAKISANSKSLRKGIGLKCPARCWHAMPPSTGMRSGASSSTETGGRGAEYYEVFEPFVGKYIDRHAETGSLFNVSDF